MAIVLGNTIAIFGISKNVYFLGGLRFIKETRRLDY